MIDEFSQLFRLVGLGFMLMLPLSNPLTSMTLLLSLGSKLNAQERALQVRQATFYVIGVILVTYYAGHFIINGLGISLQGIRIAGGLIVAFIGFNMLFPASSVDDMPEADHARDQMEKTGRKPNIAFVPLALPGTAGPGTMAMAISLSSQLTLAKAHYVPWVRWTAPIVVTLLLGVLFWACLRSAGAVIRVLGHDGVDAISRVMGFLLVCMGVQLVINGVMELVGSLH